MTRISGAKPTVHEDCVTARVEAGRVVIRGCLRHVEQARETMANLGASFSRPRSGGGPVHVIRSAAVFADARSVLRLVSEAKATDLPVTLAMGVDPGVDLRLGRRRQSTLVRLDVPRARDALEMADLTLQAMGMALKGEMVTGSSKDPGRMGVVALVSLSDGGEEGQESQEGDEGHEVTLLAA